MDDDEKRRVLARIEAARDLQCEGKQVEMWRNFDNEETRLRVAPKTPAIRVDEDALFDFLNESNEPTSEAVIRNLLCAIAAKPSKYGRLVVP